MLDFFSSHGIQPRFSCPYTSPQNGRAERTLRTINNLVRVLLFQSHMPNTYWVEALHMAAHLFNILPSTAIDNQIPFTRLFNKTPSYDHLRVFGCLCYPNLLATSSNKLSPRSTRCVFLGYPSHHRGYRCLDLDSRRIILSQKVIFNEATFPFFSTSTPSSINTPIAPTSYHPSLFNLGSSLSTLPSSASPVTNTSPPQPSSLPSENPSSVTPEPIPSHDTSSTNVAPSPAISVPVHPHQMQTRSKSGINKAKNIVSLHTDLVSPLPRSHIQAARDPNWNASMKSEYDAQVESGTWDLVPRPLNTNVVRSMWLFSHKFNADGTLRRHKSRLVANGKSQQVGVDCEETFSPVIKPTTIRTVLHLAVSWNWPLHQLDVKKAFLHETLKETVYMHQPPGFVDPEKPNHVRLLKKSLYGLKQSPRAWFQRFTQYATKIGFKNSKSDTSLFVYRQGSELAYLLLYVDDIILTASSSTILRSILSSLKSEFSMTDLGLLHYFLGISVRMDNNGSSWTNETTRQIYYIALICPTAIHLQPRWTHPQNYMPLMGLQSKIQRSIVASPVLYNISLSLALISRMPYNKYVCTCMILASRISLPSNVSFVT